MTDVTKTPDLRLVAENDAVIEDDTLAAPAVLTRDTLPALANQMLDDRTTERDIQDQFEAFLVAGIDVTLRNAWRDEVRKRVNLGIRDLNRIMAQAQKEHERRLAEAEASQDAAKGIVLMDPEEADIEDMRAKTIEALAKLRDEPEPPVYLYVDALSWVRTTANGRPKFEILESERRLRHVINRLGLFGYMKGERKDRRVVKQYAPDALVTDVWDSDRTEYAAPLVEVRHVPFLSSTGWVAINGYHRPTMSYLTMPLNLRLPSWVADPDWAPTEEEVRAALLAIQDVVHDFPIDALSPDDLKRAALGEIASPSFTALVGFLCLCFVRGLIAGPTPLHLLDKPAAGTGASLLAKVLGIIVEGRPFPERDLPPNLDEISKTLTALFTSQAMVGFFDNVNHSVDSGPLASAITKTVHGARILGQTKEVEVEVRTIWLMAANTITMSSELLRRVIPIRLDAKMDKPEKRSKWTHKNVVTHVEGKRGEIIAAVMTIVQNWRCKGSPRHEARSLSSFEDYSMIIGGIVEAAALQGWLDPDHLNSFTDAASDTTDDGLLRLMTRLAVFEVGTIFRSGSATRPRNAETGKPEEGPVVSIRDELNASCSGTGDEDPILLKGWGYKEIVSGGEMTYTYGSAGLIGKRFAKAAQRPHKVPVVSEDGTMEMVDLHLEERRDPKNNGAY